MGSPFGLRQTYRPTRAVGKSKRFTTQTGYEICGLAPCSVQVCCVHAWKLSFGIMLLFRISSVGCRYPPGFRCMRMNSISFFMIAFGSYGFPKNLLLAFASKVALAI